MHDAGSHLYLIRLNEAGREAQPKHGRQRRDVAAAIARKLPDCTIATDVGRIFVETAEEASAALAEVHGIASFSPCTRCRLEELERTAVERAKLALQGRRSFLVKVKRVGEHDFTSMEMAARLGEKIGEELTNLRVDVHDPEVTIGVEIRGEDCYVFDTRIDGVDRRDAVPREAEEAPRFVVDQMLGPLAVWLRLLGFDSVYVRDEPDTVLLRKASEEGRIILTRDVALSEARSVRTLFLESGEPDDQLVEVIEGLGLRLSKDAMFTRCTICNRPVQRVNKESVKDRLPEVAYRLYDEFTACSHCDKVYWKGGQYDRILDRLAGVLEE
jgi:uncharacterized protein with PIN domain/tRNA(Ser,Leu) C12 N-acetylase TAN1